VVNALVDPDAKRADSELSAEPDDEEDPDDAREDGGPKTGIGNPEDDSFNETAPREPGQPVVENLVAVDPEWENGDVEPDAEGLGDEAREPTSPFRPGDRVRVTGLTYFGTDHIGSTGVVIANQCNNTPAGHEAVEIPDPEDEDDPYHVFLAWGNLEKLPDEPYDDLAALREVSPDYAADSRLVDLVVRVAQAAVANYTESSSRTSRQFFGNGDRVLNDAWRDYVRELLVSEADNG
jgi:hypothetical protein